MDTNEVDIDSDHHRRGASVSEGFNEAAAYETNGDPDGNRRHGRAASTPAQQAKVDKLSSPNQGTQQLSSQAGFGSVTEWIDGAKVLTTAEDDDGKVSQAFTGFAWSLYQHTLELFSHLFPLLMALPVPSNDGRREKSFKKSLGRLFLWGDGFRGGKLESILDESEGLRETIIESLAAIGKILLLKLAPQCLENSTPSDYERIRRDIRDLEISVEKARILTEGDYESDGSLTFAGSVAADDSSLETENALRVYVGCLMELLPSMEETLSSLDYHDIEDQENQSAYFQVSGPAQPYVLKVYDKFPKADVRLMQRLGEANWQRHMSLRMLNNQIEDLELPQEMPKAVFVAVSMFHDSGIGSSIPAQSAYAATVASHSSFQSTAAEKISWELHVPPTPKEVLEGVPFSCEICGHVLRRIKNRTDWRRHVFADLKPYICTFSECKDEWKTFPTRTLWEDHEFGQHRQKRYWSCSTCQYKAGTPEEWRAHLQRTHDLFLSDDQYILASPAAKGQEPVPIELQSCPLCLEVPGKSQRHFATHVGKHMESIALAALPREAEVTDSEESVASGVSSISDVPSSSILPEDVDAVSDVPSTDQIPGPPSPSLQPLVEHRTDEDLHNNPFALPPHLNSSFGNLDKGLENIVRHNVNLPVDLLENATAAFRPSGTLSEEAGEDESILRGMVQRKQSASAVQKGHYPDCENEFKRPGDHFKNEKTHSGSWKCSVATCNFHKYGYATERDLKRHYTKKHGATPPMYECYFKPCPYRSKRESNCKQHMEIAHGWEYVRSKDERKNTFSAPDGSPRLGPVEDLAEPMPGSSQGREIEIHIDNRRDDRYRQTGRTNDYFVPKDGINREVIIADICRYLGRDALVRPGGYENPETRTVQRGYVITAYSNLTPSMIDDLKADSARWEAEQTLLVQPSNSG